MIAKQSFTFHCIALMANLMPGRENGTEVACVNRVRNVH